MKLQLTQDQVSELQLALKNKSYAPFHRRIQCILLRSEGLTLTAIANLLGFVPQTVKNQIDKYLSEGLSSILKETRGGRNRQYLTLEEEQEFLKEHLSNSLTGEFVTIDTLYKAYQERVGHLTTREGFYALLKRHGWRKMTPRPEHPKKADAKTILASKNKIYVQEDKKALRIQ